MIVKAEMHIAGGQRMPYGAQLSQDVSGWNASRVVSMLVSAAMTGQIGLVASLGLFCGFRFANSAAGLNHASGPPSTEC